MKLYEDEEPADLNKANLDENNLHEEEVKDNREDNMEVSREVNSR